LRNVAREKQASFDVIVRRYAIERLLYRISQSSERNRFVLKGAMLYTAWVADPFRPTQDLDLLGFGDAAPTAMATTFAAICQHAVPEDGITFNVASIRADAIRGNQEYGGVNVRMEGRLGNIRIPIHIDIGFGDAVTPAIVDLIFPALLDAPAPQLRAYPRETVVAEKFEAMVALGQANTRMKDYYDLAALSRYFDFQGTVVRDAIAATFNREVQAPWAGACRTRDLCGRRPTDSFVRAWWPRVGACVAGAGHPQSSWLSISGMGVSPLPVRTGRGRAMFHVKQLQLLLFRPGARSARFRPEFRAARPRP
jgi:hypothetical protein